MYELTDTAWRLNRVPLLEADVLSRAQSPADGPDPPSWTPTACSLRSAPTVNVCRGNSKRPSTNFTNSNSGVSSASGRTCATPPLFQFHKHKGLPYNPAEDGFVFSKTEIEAFAQRTMRLNEAWKVDNFTLLGFRTPRNPRILKSVDAIC